MKQGIEEKQFTKGSLEMYVNVIIMLVLVAICTEIYNELEHCSKVFHCINSVIIPITL